MVEVRYDEEADGVWVSGLDDLEGRESATGIGGLERWIPTDMLLKLAEQPIRQGIRKGRQIGKTKLCDALQGVTVGVAIVDGLLGIVADELCGQ